MVHCRSKEIFTSRRVVAKPDRAWDRKCDCLAARAPEPVRIEALSRHGGDGHIHPSALFQCHAMSPLQYQKQSRLHEACRLLLTEPLDTSTAAFRVGYDVLVHKKAMQVSRRAALDDLVRASEDADGYDL
jgi:AraC-like DNA-binding protein